MMVRSSRVVASVATVFALTACGPTNPPADARADTATADAATEDRVDVATATDNGGDVVTDAPTTMDATDAALDAVSDVAVDDADDASGDTVDAVADAGADVPVDSGRFTLPSSCTTNAECGPDARCDTTIGRCVCTSSALPCGESCCPWHYELNVTFPSAGHIPEIGGDTARNRFVLYHFGANQVRLATFDAAGAMRTESIATSSGIEDDADMTVAPDGTVDIAIHTDIGSRDGAFTLYERAPGATSFTTRNLRPSGATPFAYDAAVAIARANNGDLYTAVAPRSGDGTSGLSISRLDHGTGVWTTLPTVLTVWGFSRSELFAQNDGFFVRTHDSSNREYFYDYAPDASLRSLIIGDPGPVYTHGATAGALDDSGRLWMYSIDRIDTSDHSVTETFTFPTGLGGLRSDMDMATDVDGNPVMLFHSITTHSIGLMTRMPHGGWTAITWLESFFLPAGVSSDYMTLDLERLPSGNLAFAIGDSMDRGSLVYREITR